ncbi:hypothetical protein H4R33_004522 [Dimargaris cristalligena]|nr:hypothetical protein H4R33_004522 [Dimargaris cristalligena]
MEKVLNQLPTEILGLVVRELPWDDRISLSCTNRRLRALLMPHLFHQVKAASAAAEYCYSIFDDPHAPLRRVGHWARKVRYNLAKAQVANTSWFLSQSLVLAPNLTRLYLTGFPYHYSLDIQYYILPLAAQLTHLSMGHGGPRDCTSTITRPVAPHRLTATAQPTVLTTTATATDATPSEALFACLMACKRLVSLELIGTQWRLSQAQWTAVLRAHPGLLKLKARGWADDHFAAALLTGAAHQLELLQLSFHEISGPMLAQIPPCLPYLRSFFLYPLPVRDSSVVENVHPGVWPHLTYLDMTCSKYDRLPDSAPTEHLAQLQNRYRQIFRAKWPHLTHLGLGGLILPGDIFGRIGRQCPRLKSLAIIDCQATDKGSRTLLEQCTQLRHLVLRDVTAPLTAEFLPGKLGSTHILDLTIVLRDFNVNWLASVACQLSRIKTLTLSKFNKQPNPKDLEQLFPAVKGQLDETENRGKCG